MQELAKNVLILSKEENDSNEVAITCDLGTKNPLEQYGISLGTEHYMMRENGYDYKNAFQLFRECIADLTRNSPVQEQYLSSLSFLAKCSEVGLYYR